MVRVIVGDIFASRAQTLVNTVNCVGVMGAGIALEFKRRFPEYYEDYRERCKQGKVKLGSPYLYKRLGPPWILSFPTKDHWRSMTRLDDIVRGLEWIQKHYKEWGIESLAVPPLGAGHGQLEWRVVGPTLYRYLKLMDIPVELYAPYGIPNTELRPEFLEEMGASSQRPPQIPDPRWLSPALVAVVEILKRIGEQPYRKPIGRTIFQKIAYLATEEGLPTGLEFRKSSFGPFAPDLKKAMTRLLNNGLIEEAKMGRMWNIRLGPTYEDARRAYETHLTTWNPIIDRIADLLIKTGLDTNTAEIVTSVIFAARRLKEIQGGAASEIDVLRAVLDWKRKRRPPLDEGRVAYAIRYLAGLGWIDVSPSDELRIPQVELAA